MKILFKYIIPSIAIIFFTYLRINDKIHFSASDYISFGLTLLTYFYVVFTWEMLEKIKTESYLERRPYLVSDFKSQKNELYFYIENIGKTPAIDVEIKINPDFELINVDSINNSIFKDKIEFYPPKKVVKTFINSTNVFFRKNPNKFDVTISYKDTFNNKFSEHLTLDLNHHKKQNYVIEKDINDLIKSLENIKKVLEKK